MLRCQVNTSNIEPLNKIAMAMEQYLHAKMIRIEKRENQ